MYRLISIVAILFLAGCSTTHSKFSCGVANSPIRCQPLSVVDQRINAGILNLPKPKVSGVKAIVHTNSMPIRTINLSKPFSNFKHDQMPIRIKEKRLSVWVAAFVDKHDVYHGEQWLDLVVAPARWQENVVNVRGA